MPNLIIPCRYDPAAGWVNVTSNPARATAWHAIPAKGKPARFASKRAAKDYLARCKRVAKPQRSFSFVARCPQRVASDALLATSLNHNSKGYNS